jgi:hypothetical protein
MTAALSLRAALKRGALVTAANWPVVLLDFAIETLYKFALTVPVAGGALLVAAVLGGDVRGLVGGGVTETIDLALATLADAPLALMSFLTAVLIVAAGGGLLMMAVKIGGLAMLVETDRRAGDSERTSQHFASLRRASVCTARNVLDASRRFGPRAMRLGMFLGTAYGAIGAAWLLVVTASLRLSDDDRVAAAWPLVVLVATIAAGLAVLCANLLYDLLRVIVVTDDCSVRAGFGRLRAFAAADFRQIVAICGVVSLVLLAGLAVATPAMAAFTFVSWVPVAGLIAAPLQIVAWLVQGLVFQYVGLAALSAYQTRYRRLALEETALAAAAPVQS